MTSELCKKLGGTVNPNNIEMCCLRCSNPKGWQDVRKEECPSPPNFFYPSTSFAGHVNCCYTNGGSAPTPTPVPSPSPGSSTSATVGTTSNTGSLNGVCQIYQGCVVGTVNGQQGCYTSASITAGTYQACSPAAYLWTNANGFKQCCKNAQP